MGDDVLRSAAELVDAIGPQAALAQASAAWGSSVDGTSSASAAGTLAAVRVIARLDELSRQSESALRAGQLVHARDVCQVFHDVRKQDRLVRNSNYFTQMMAEDKAVHPCLFGPYARVIAVERAVMRDALELLKECCLVFEPGKYATSLRVLNPMGSPREGHVLVMQEYTNAFERAASLAEQIGSSVSTSPAQIRQPFESIGNVLVSFCACLRWHALDEVDDSTIGSWWSTEDDRFRRMHAALLRTSVPYIGHAASQLTVTFLRTADFQTTLTPSSLFSMYHSGRLLNVMLECFVRRADVTLSTLHAFCLAPDVHAHSHFRCPAEDTARDVPSAGHPIFSPRRGRVRKSVVRNIPALWEASPGPIALALKSRLLQEWNRFHQHHLSETGHVLASEQWLPLGMSSRDIASTVNNIERSMKISKEQPLPSVADAATALENGVNIVVSSTPVSSPAIRSLRMGDGEGSRTGAPSEVVFTVSSRAILRNITDKYMFVAREVPELRSYACQGSAELLLSHLRSSLSLVPTLPRGAESGEPRVLESGALRNILRGRGNGDGCTAIEKLSLSDFLSSEMQGKLANVVSSDDSFFQASSPSKNASSEANEPVNITNLSIEDVRAVSTAFEASHSLGSLIRRVLTIIKDDMDVDIDKSKEHLGFCEAVLQLLDPVRDAVYLLLGWSTCKDMSKLTLRGEAFEKEDADLPSEASLFMVQYHKTAKEFIQAKGTFDPDTQDRLCMALCRASSTCLLDVFSNAANCTVLLRMQMLCDTRVLQQNMESLTGLKTIPGISRLRQYVQAWFLPNDDKDIWIKDKRGELALLPSHIEGLRRGGGSNLRFERLQRDGSELAAKVRSFSPWKPGSGSS